MKQKIKCESCGKVIANGEKPARPLDIKCSHCGVLNDVSKPSSQQSFADRLALEKK